MIRRISKNNDLKDLIKSCPSGVIDDITEIRYFISGQPQTEIVADFEKVGNHLEAILPTSDLETLSNGVLMRRAFYKVSDPAYPDGYYNLEFVDNLAVWLGDEETEDPYDPGYLTEDDLKTINGESLVGVGNIDVVNYIPDYYATKSWVSDQGYAKQSALNSLSTTVENLDVRVSAIENRLPQDYNTIATENWVIEYLSSEYYMTESDVYDFLVSQSYVTEESLSSHQFATESWVQSQGYITSAGLSGLATQSWVLSQGYITSSGLSGLATQSWVLDQGYITSETLPEDIATQSWVESYVSECDFAAAADVDALSRWIVSQNYATQSWVSSQQFITSAALTGYATQSWVQNQGYISSIPSDYATKSWVSTNYVGESEVWTGTFDQWVQLTPEQQNSYKIALIVE